jgi:hypothetical protein
MYNLWGQGEERAEPPLPAGAAKPDTLRSEEVIIAAGDFRLAGTFYAPDPGGPAPAVVFVHGAGPAVRSDGYHELGRHFARNGVAALIYCATSGPTSFAAPVTPLPCWTSPTRSFWSSRLGHVRNPR